MNEGLTKEKLTEYLDNYFYIIKNGLTTKEYEKRLRFDEIYDLLKDLFVMMSQLYDLDKNECSKEANEKLIPLLNLLIKIDTSKDHKKEYSNQIKEAYRIGARTSLKNYFIYREWEQPLKDRLYHPRVPIMGGYLHYLEEITYNPNFRLLIVNFPSGYGKTFPEKISEAWNFGVDPTGTVLSICSNERVVNGGSRTVMDEMKSEAFGEVFPELKYIKGDKSYFIKETAEEWKLKDCKMLASYYTSTTQSNIVGVRASQRIHIDDLYGDYKEALSQSLNEYYFNKNETVWSQRFVQDIPSKEVITGTLWSSGDFIARVIENVEKTNKMIKDPVYPYTRVNKDRTIAIIQVPALDYKTHESTCPMLKSTEAILETKNKIEEYLFETNFQQKPTDPEAMFFSYKKLRQYHIAPPSITDTSLAVIDATRKSGKDYFAMPILHKTYGNVDNLCDYVLKDTLFTKTATKDMYEPICEKIKQHHIVKLVIESNVTSELSQNIREMLENDGITYCEIIEKYNTVPKAERIEAEKSNILRRIIFPQSGDYGANTDMGKAMNNLTLYNGAGRNENDDFPDALALFSHEIIEENSISARITPIKRPF